MSKVYEDDNNYGLLKTTTKYGVVLWFGLFILNVILLLTKWYTNDNQIIITLLSLLVQIGVTIAAVRIAKSSNYSKRALVGVLTSFFAGIISIASIFATTTLIQPDFFTEQRDRAELLFIEAEYSDDQIDELLKAYEEPVVRYAYPISTWVKTVFSGVIISLIVAAFIKERDEKL